MQHLLGDAGDGKRGHGATEVAVRIAVLESADEQGIERGAGHHAELSGQGDGAGEGPARDADAHAPLYDRGKG